MIDKNEWIIIVDEKSSFSEVADKIKKIGFSYINPLEELAMITAIGSSLEMLKALKVSGIKSIEKSSIVGTNNATEKEKIDLSLLVSNNTGSRRTKEPLISAFGLAKTNTGRKGLGNDKGF